MKPVSAFTRAIVMRCIRACDDPEERTVRAVIAWTAGLITDDEARGFGAAPGKRAA